MRDKSLLAVCQQLLPSWQDAGVHLLETRVRRWGIRFDELDWRSTTMRELTLRRRVELSLGVDVFELRRGDEYLMSSLFTVAEEQLATLGLAAAESTGLRVRVGGLGLVYTAVTAL